MMESLKTALLVLLVATSLVQSYLLAYSRPNVETVDQPEYVAAELKGTQAETADVLFPSQIVLHFGGDKHTVLPVNHQFYRMIYGDLLQKNKFEGIHRVSSIASIADWYQIGANNRGIEVRFEEGIPLSMLQSSLRLQTDTPASNDLITSVWIYEKDQTDARIAFLTDSNLIVYEATKSYLDVRILDQYINLGEYLTPYHRMFGDYYLPDAPVTAVKLKMGFTEFTQEQLKRSLFADPGITRVLPERDGSQIYTDAKRGLQIRSDLHWFSFSDPVSAPVDSKNDIKENLVSAIQFVNQHGGWNSDYLYSRLRPKAASGPQTIVFRQMVEGYPVIDAKNGVFGSIEVVLQKGVVSNYDRSLINLDDKSAVRSQVTLPGGKELEERLKNFGQSSYVRVFPAYEPAIVDKTVELTPRWAIELADGSFEFLP